MTVDWVAGSAGFRDEPVAETARGIMSDTVLDDLMPDVALIGDIFGNRFCVPEFRPVEHLGCHE